METQLKIWPERYELKRNKTNEATEWNETWTEQTFESHWTELNGEDLAQTVWNLNRMRQKVCWMKWDANRANFRKSQVSLMPGIRIDQNSTNLNGTRQMKQRNETRLEWNKLLRLTEQNWIEKILPERYETWTEWDKRYAEWNEMPTERISEKVKSHSCLA